MYYRYPIERVASTTSIRFQSGFARMAMYLLPMLEDVVYEPTSLGLKILASDELALDVPVEILNQVYGAEVRITEPRVRMLRDADGIKEPVMSVRVAMPTAKGPAVLDDLMQRTALIQEVDRQPAFTVMRAQAALRGILGYRQSLAALTGNTAELWMSLSHYELVPTDPDGVAA